MAPWHVGRIHVGGYAEGFPWEASGWRYKYFANGSEPNASQPGFDDSDWSGGQAPFGAAVGFQGDPFHGSLPYARTYWPLNTTIWIRRRVTGQGTFRIKARYDNDIWMYWEGALVFQGSASIADTPEFTVNSPGDGLMAIKVRDNGIANYADAEAVLL